MAGPTEATRTAENPYSFVATYYGLGLDSLATHLTPPDLPSFTNLIGYVYDYIVADLYDSGNAPKKLEGIEIKTGINTTISGYINANRTNNELVLTDAQLVFAKQLVNDVLNIKNPEDIKQHILDVQEKVLNSKLTAEQQMPLLYASAMGVAAYDYWLKRGFDSTSPWLPYVTSFTPAIVKFPVWVSASMEATLIAISTMHTTNDNPLAVSILDAMNKVQGKYLVNIIGGAIAVAGGKVLFQWTQRVA